MLFSFLQLFLNPFIILSQIKSPCFRKDIFTLCEENAEPVIDELSIDEIFNGIPGTEYQVSK